MSNLPKVIPGFFWMAVGLGTYWLVSIGRFKAWSALTGISIAIALFAYGAWLVRAWPGQREKTREAPLIRGQEAGRPWILTRAWRRRRIVHASPVGTGVMVLAWIFFGLPALFFLGGGILGGVSLNTRVEGLAMGGALAFVVASITYWRLRQWRFGDSICRLITLPGAVGGWLKADVECGVPGGGMATVRLRNMVPGKPATEVWRMEAVVDVPAGSGGRTLLPVRLEIPRSREQRMTPLQPGTTEWLVGGPWWLLEIEQKLPGIDFFASFVVPVYDVPPSLVDEGSPPPELPEPPDRVRPVLANGLVVLGLVALAILTQRANWPLGGFFSPSNGWLSSHAFARQLDVWPEYRFFPETIEGRCADGVVQYRGEWKPLPAGTRFVAWYALPQRHYELKDREYRAAGYQLHSKTSHADCAGVTRVQAVWLKNG